MIEISRWEEGCSFRIKAHAGARRERVGGEYAGALRVEVNAAPERGKANAAILKLLAKALNVPAKDLSIISGETNPEKRVGVRGLAVEELLRRLDELTREN